jgi:hypothetical protein
MPEPHDIPIQTMIRRDIVDTLNKVRIVAGYHCDIEAEEAKQEGNSRAPGKVIVERVGFDKPADEAMGKTDRQQIFKLYAYVGQSANSNKPVAELIDIMEADIEKSLCADEPSSQRSGYGLITEVSDGLIGFESESALHMIILTVTVTSRSGFFDAYYY